MVVLDCVAVMYGLAKPVASLSDESQVIVLKVVWHRYCIDTVVFHPWILGVRDPLARESFFDYSVCAAMLEYIPYVPLDHLLHHFLLGR
jgi:hypothetical protein